MEINRPGDLVDIANLGLALSEAKRLLAGVQREVVAAQIEEHAVRRPDCSRCGSVCRVKDYRDHAMATLFGQVTMRLPRFCCAACGGIEAGVGWSVGALRRVRGMVGCPSTSFFWAPDAAQAQRRSPAPHPEDVVQGAELAGI